ncbi:recombinase family protein [Paenibacillus sp. MZ04-78.2]|uniref:recombinase family protein n=1 Tax=Paenibacillus sp. MZ04-78.2 TaxID=2962034 RepID=UPI0020B8AA68|nr:recombinase family protein [Paenibacillus sp. MZ04-78.2]MCP3775491.1 recombinase family protein [Paenibacillus sp. MZ04-78.2]
MNVIGYVRVSKDGYVLSYQCEETEANCQEKSKVLTRIKMKRRSFYGGMYQYADVEVIGKHQVIL